ncbi:glutathione ABC transporter substrate-binding protein [Bacillus sp. FJAT-45350]|uniref:glutathione ABC transporter substrate-binding protein n=1 Tax=Bacillus sp. FJAT-45350 TaxID=2011014 RepID=UPI000BB70186|nr:glutathione ABC transporter substrate-binding protein [Bacillus sp. FJAT-45350]
MVKSKFLRAGVFSIVASLMLVGCSNDSDVSSEQEPETDGDTSTEEVAGGGDLIVGVLSDATSLDPHISSDVPSGVIQVNMFETLTKFNEDMELEPLLAESWEPVEEQVWEFKLREGVQFHDGTDFNAEVVKANVERLLDEELASPRRMLVELVEEIVVVDDHTIQFVMEEPFAPLPAHFAHYSASIVSLGSIEEDYAAVEAGAQHGTYINENPVGTGFFEFVSWNPGTEIHITNFDGYWGDNAKVDSVTFKVIPEDLTRLAELETGGAHIIDPVQVSDLSRVENTDGIHAYQRNRATVTYMGFNNQKAPFDDARVRMAVAKTINKDTMVDGVLDGIGEKAIGPINDTQWGYSDQVNVIERDVEAAKELLAEAGYADGFSTTIYTNDNRERMDNAEIIQADLREIGIEAEIEVVEWGAYLDMTGAGEYDGMFILGLSLGTMDADYPMHMLFHSNSAGVGNRSFFLDETFDQIITEARVEQDEATRLQMYVDAVNYLNEEVPMAFLYHPESIMGVRNEVKGFWADASAVYQLQNVTIEQ